MEVFGYLQVLHLLVPILCIKMIDSHQKWRAVGIRAIATMTERVEPHAIMRQAGDEAEDDCCCPICLMTYREMREQKRALVKTKSCGHVFCGLCLKEWLVDRVDCPLCRMDIKST
jgi:hypothetical protein